MADSKYLTEAERQFVQAKINRFGPTPEIKAKKIYGLDWPPKDRDPYGLGDRFKASVIAGHLSRIRFVRTGTDNHARYEIG